MKKLTIERALQRIQILEHERQWCDTEDVSNVEEALEDAELDLRELLSPANRPENAPLLDVALLIAQQPALDLHTQLQQEREGREKLDKFLRAFTDGQSLLRMFEAQEHAIAARGTPDSEGQL